MTRVQKFAAGCVCAGLVAFALTGVRAFARDQQDPVLHESHLESATVSDVAPGEVVVTLSSHGDLRGMLTLKLEVDSNGTVTGGDWALVSTYVEDLNEDGTVNLTPHTDEPGAPHENERMHIVDKGTIGGRITGGSVATGSNGGSALSNVQIEVLSGTLSFSSVSAGTGTVDVDFGAGDELGALRLTF